MQEELKKNFILLSQVAKEKKYAQEYLGLLARRGDIGSVRIGKRWYTTWAWFEEFLENSQKKKSEAVCEAPIAAPEKIDEMEIFAKVEITPIQKENEIKINLSSAAPVKREKIDVSPKTEMAETQPIFIETPAVAEEKKNIVPQIRINNFQTRKPVSLSKEFEKKSAGLVEIKRVVQRANIPVPQRMQSRVPFRNIAGDVSGGIRTESQGKVSIAERNRYAVSYPEIKLKKKGELFSPDFSAGEKIRAAFLPRFAFAVSFVLMFLLVAISGYFVYSGGLLGKGTVAGASDERISGFSSIKSGGDYYLAGAGDKMKESISLSTVIVEAVAENAMVGETADSSKIDSNVSAAISKVSAPAATSSGSKKKKK